MNRLAAPSAVASAKIHLFNDYEHPLKLMNTVTTLLHDTATAPTDENIITIAIRIVNTSLVASPLFPILHAIKALLFLLTQDEQDRAEILAQCEFLKEGGR